MIAHRSRHGAVNLVFTDRAGGVSSGAYAELNLAGHVGDDMEAVAANRARLAAALDLPTGRVVYMNQVHGADVALVDGPWPADPPAVDAMVTSRPGLALAVLVADCVPVLLADPSARVVGVAHAGRPGLVAGVVPAVVTAMRAAGAQDLIARIGPAVCGSCYEVPTSMRADVTSVVPQAWAMTGWGTPAVDVRAGVAAQLQDAGVDVVAWKHSCTVESDTFFSYRRDRTTGRLAGLVWMDASERGSLTG